MAAAAAAAHKVAAAAGPGAAAEVVLEGYLDKMPTWWDGPSTWGHEDNFKVRYFVLRGARLEYYKTQRHQQSGVAPRGTVAVRGSVLRRESRLEFTIASEKKRLVIRAMSEQLALQWLAALMQQGAVPASAS